MLDEDVPWADPAIREAYEAALGRLILAHNEVDYRLTTVIAGAAEQLGGGPLTKLAEGDFSRRVGNLEVLQALDKKLSLWALILAYFDHSMGSATCSLMGTSIRIPMMVPIRWWNVGDT